MAKDKKDKGNGSNGNGGAPEEAHVEQASTTPAEQSTNEALTVDASPADAIPPDPQTDGAPDASPTASHPDVASLSTDELKSSWATTRDEIDALDHHVSLKRGALRIVEQELCERYKKVADAQRVEPVVMIGGRRMKVKARQARVGGGLGFVDAPIRAAIEL